jgi:hypothetical protein
MAIQWAFLNGSEWCFFDQTSQVLIENMWTHNAANWITCRLFPGAVYLDTSDMMLVHNGISYTIARTNR